MPRLPASHLVPLLGCDIGRHPREKVNSKQFRRTINEEQFPILLEAGSVFVGHVAPSSGSAQNIANRIRSFLTETGSLLYELEVIGCDENFNNSGWKSCVICQI
ncbi:hypothetical protein AVEN_221955-1 [Araneus ventricosus]|uniref:Uncharacterized protein n=1 Tax=Araneus ventricosus TaxID=182803 RepID=A0A4Y2F887_ARAVE|nr:hypothetical protein AVEN_221955-1 [Araneus ventricosus]